MPIVGTAGHVDHGKSTIVRALTGTDPDRWAEEKERGLTIDLGFAWTDLDGFDVGFVDVPGHERFVKNMLAGVGALDCALFVVAADSGWMPQSEEHAAVLDLLDMESGVIALSRVDLVDDETVELATLEILEEIEGTALERWPIVPVSAVTNTGMDALREAIVAALRSNASNNDDTPFRLWVDRAFSVSGAGQVVTGTVLSGSATVDDELILLPAGTPARVRGLHHHGAPVERVVGGDRTAVNVAGSGVDASRGMLLTRPGVVATTRRLLAMIRPTRSFEAIPDRGAFHLHIGTASLPASVRRVDHTDCFMVMLDEPAAGVVGDRVILRDSGRRSVVGGGRVLDTDPPNRPTADQATQLMAKLGADPDGWAQALLDLRGNASLQGLAAATLGGRPSVAIGRGDLVISERHANDVARAIVSEATDFHTAHPTRPGIAKATFVTSLGISPEILDAVIARSADLTETSGAVHLATFSNSLTDDEERQWERVRADLELSYDVPRLTALDLPADVVHFLLRRGDLIRIDDDLAFTSDQAQAITDGVEQLKDGFTVSEFKEHFGMARRQAVPTVEWLDSIGRTRRSGDGRTVRSRS